MHPYSKFRFIKLRKYSGWQPAGSEDGEHKQCQKDVRYPLVVIFSFFLSFFLSIVIGSLNFEHYARECEF